MHYRQRWERLVGCSPTPPSPVRSANSTKVCHWAACLLLLLFSVVTERGVCLCVCLWVLLCNTFINTPWESSKVHVLFASYNIMPSNQRAQEFSTAYIPPDIALFLSVFQNALLQHSTQVLQHAWLDSPLDWRSMPWCITMVTCSWRPLQSITSLILNWSCDCWNRMCATPRKPSASAH